MKTLETERLLLRPWTLDDARDLYAFAKHPDVGPNAGWRPHESKAESVKIIQMFIEKNETWAVVHKADGRVIGSLGLHADRVREGVNARMLGYVLSPEYWGCGLMPEAAQQAIRFAFDELGVDVLSVYHFPQNDRSRRVIEKCGFTYEGTLRRAMKLYDGSVLDELCYSITREEYLAW